jgi:hypothetical protein
LSNPIPKFELKKQPTDFLVVATMKNEGPFILEWLAYHFLIGFRRFVIFTNDCSDDTAEILKLAADTLGNIEHFDNSERRAEPGRRHTDPQRRAYRWAGHMDTVRKADFVMVLDADEFLSIKTPEGILQDLIDAVEPFDALSINWRFFGNSDKLTFEDKLVLEQFDHARGAERPTHVRKWGVKTLFRPENVQKIGVHRPYHTPEIKGGSKEIRWLNGSGADVLDHFRDCGWRSNRKTFGAKFAEVNHYSLRSSEAFLMKCQRGSANTTDLSRLNADYFELFNHNEVRELHAKKWADRITETISQWYLINPNLAVLHRKSVLFHKKGIANLRKEISHRDPEFLNRIGVPLWGTNKNEN